ncbi:peptidase inhibitor family I36 protein [Streptomyces sp. NPDC058045]|uniref:peptidase inhibitor family I36 protein n=1 Tax=Streptomyces sp. NPDC058045 TaxID=3346311 RepID=UPI0036EEE873
MHTTTRRTLTALLTPAVAALVLGAAPAPTAAHATAPAAAEGKCAAGQLCLWERAEYRGAHRTYELTGTDIESCVRLPAGHSAQALANRTGRPVTTYQSAECAETAEFNTYPGDGTWLPRSAYAIRAVKIWER